MQKQALHDTQVMSKFRVLTMKDACTGESPPAVAS